MSTQSTLPSMMAEKTDQELLDMFSRPADWTPDAIDAARAELQKRGLRPIESSPQQPPNRDFELLPSGRKRYLRATPLDIIISIFLPGWGIIVGGIALFLKRETKRGVTMIVIGIAILVLLIATRQF